ncbi:SRPBCC family protein [Kocuria sp. SM24M-10]|uniref:SRPBCC family protein n=1 Tax=Kocuria sp. SM24M-10 TaxID=1660349 RepID=UPI00064B0A5C|nr:SRPBCC family protein [Kocuria sp. SM24M-10]KLU11438.1 cyclase [Kocuria sp. SM24M-10]
MSTKVEKTVVVDVPLSTVYNQWTQFEDFPQFMNGVKSVRQLSDSRLEWVAEIGGVRRQWEARIVDQVPDSRVSWAATEGATNAGTVMFHDAGNGRTEVHLVLEYEPEGLVEKAGDKLNVVENQAEGDLERFKKFIEDEGYATGAWRGSVDEGAPVGTPGVEAAAASRGDDGKAGISGKVVAAGVAAAGVAAAGAAAAAKKKDSDEDTEPVTFEADAAPAPTTPTVTPVAPETAVPGEVPPVAPTGPALTDPAVDADVDVDPTSGRTDGRPAGGAV